MTFNYPGPFGLRMFYTTVISSIPLQHRAEYNIDLQEANPIAGTPFGALNVKLRGGTTQLLSAYCDAWVALVRPILSAGGLSTIDYFELWKYTPQTFDAVFVSTYPVNLAATGASGTQTASQSILTFRTVLGGIMRLSFMETMQTPAAFDTPPLSSAAYQAIADHVVSIGNAFLGRDGAYPFSTIAFFPGQNEKLFKKRLR